MASILALLLMLSIIGCSKGNDKPILDCVKFKEEYEALNDKANDDGSLYSSIEIAEDNTVTYVDLDGLLKQLSNGTHVVYMGWPECGWCRRSIPVLIDEVNKYSGINIYYYNIKKDREEYEKGNKENLIAISNQLKKSEFAFDQYLESYDDGTIKPVASAIYFIQQGKVVAIHTRTVESHIDNYEPLTQKQLQELEAIFDNYLDTISQKTPIGCGECQ